jgi:HPt (histidine-containing phosphotransfer) domain-containing protein
MAPGPATERDSTPPAADPGPVVLDPAALDELRTLVGGDPAMLSGLVDDFLAETPTLLDDLRAAVAAGDPDRAQRAAHTLRSLGATFGATAIARLCQRAESQAGSPAMAHVVAEIAAEHERVSRALRRVT